MPRRPRLREGDVFSIPVSEDSIAYGQIVHKRGPTYYFAVRDGLYSSDETVDVADVARRPLRLLAYSLDGLLYAGDWKVVGRADVDVESIPWPAYKITTAPGTFEVEDYTGTLSRPATSWEAANLPYRTTMAPIYITDAIRALNELEPWVDEDYGLFLPVSDEFSTAAVFSS